MKLTEIMTTFVGAFIFSFIVKYYWNKQIAEFKSGGGYIAAGTIVGTCWILNHHIGLIHQGLIWTDMAWAVGMGSLFLSIKNCKMTYSAVKRLAAIIVGAVCASFIIFSSKLMI